MNASGLVMDLRASKAKGRWQKPGSLSTPSSAHLRGSRSQRATRPLRRAPKSSKLKPTRTFLRLPFFASLVILSACAGTPIVSAAPSSCATLLPPEWKQGVAGAPLPQGDTVADWEVFADAQTGKLDQANGRTVDAIGIVERCEARDAAAIKSATRPRFLGIKL